MWRLYFETCDFFARFIPKRSLREKVRQKTLYDYRRKFNALRRALPHGEFRHIRVIKGGWNIGFIVNNKYVCKTRKYYDKDKNQSNRFGSFPAAFRKWMRLFPCFPH